MSQPSKLLVSKELLTPILKNIVQEDYQIYFPIKPIGKQRARVTRQGHAYTPKETKKSEEDIKHLIVLGRHEMMTEAIRLEILFVLKKPKSSKRLHPTVKPDIDNYIKLVMDAANGLLWQDDSQIVSIVADKIYEAPGLSEGIYLNRRDLTMF